MHVGKESGEKVDPLWEGVGKVDEHDDSVRHPADHERDDNHKEAAATLDRFPPLVTLGSVGLCCI